MVIYNKARMFCTDLRTANGKAFQTAFFNKGSGIKSFGTFKDTACTVMIDRLFGLAFIHQSLHSVVDNNLLFGLEGECDV